MCPHGYHHSGSMATPALGTQDVHLHIVWIAIYINIYICISIVATVLILVLPWDLCGYVWFNILALSPPRMSTTVVYEDDTQVRLMFITDYHAAVHDFRSLLRCQHGPCDVPRLSHHKPPAWQDVHE